MEYQANLNKTNKNYLFYMYGSSTLPTNLLVIYFPNYILCCFKMLIYWSKIKG